MAYDTDLLALRRLQHGKRIYDRSQSLWIKGTEALINEQILK
jgi:hypothetical protein